MLQQFCKIDMYGKVSIKLWQIKHKNKIKVFIRTEKNNNYYKN